MVTDLRGGSGRLLEDEISRASCAIAQGAWEGALPSSTAVDGRRDNGRGVSEMEALRFVPRDSLIE